MEKVEPEQKIMKIRIGDQKQSETKRDGQIINN